MRARTAVVALVLVAVLAAGGAALVLTLTGGDDAGDVIDFGGDANGSERDAVVELRDGRRHVGSGPVEISDSETVTEPEGPATKAQRLQWIREWLEIACGSRYAWADRMKAQKAILEFDEAESVPLILELAMRGDDDDDEAWHWGWAMTLLGKLGPRAESAVPALMKLLRREDEDRGSSAAYALGGIGEPAIESLLESLDDARPEVQTRALTALAMIGDPPRRVTEAVIGLIGHADPEVRQSAVAALWRSGGAPDLVVPALIGAMSDTSPEVRSQAVIALYQRGPDAAAAVPALGNALDDGAIAPWAAMALGRIGPAAASQTAKLVAMLASDPEQWKDNIPRALSGIGAAALLEAMESENLRARMLAMPYVPAAVEADATAAAAAVAALDAALASENADMRRTAAETLGGLGPTAATTVPSLLKLADDTNGTVRRAALIAAVRVGGARDKVLDVLVRELSDGPDIARAAAAEALGELGADAASAVDALAVAMNDPDLVVRERAARALESIGPAAITAASSLAGRLGDDAERVRLAAAIALIAVDPPGLAARDAIEEMRISDSPKIRRRLMEGLGRHPNAVWLNVVVNRIDDRDANVRDAAAQALMHYTAHSPTVVPALIARLEKERHAGVQLALIGSLGKHGKDASVAAPLLERITSNTRTLVPVRDAAREALSKIR